MSEKVFTRRLNAGGIEEFLHYVEGGGQGPTPKQLLADPEFSEEIGWGCSIELSWQFNDRYDFAKRIWEILKPEWNSQFENDRGLWTWLALAYFDQFRPPSGQLSRREHYVFDPHRYLHYRHCAAMPIKLYRDLGGYARLFLTQSMSTMGEMLEQCMSRQYLMRSKTFIDVVKVLYSDVANGGLKPGAASKVVKKKLANGKWSTGGAGSIRRFALELLRLTLTYNLEEMKSSEVIALLGKEYDRFRPSGSGNSQKSVTRYRPDSKSIAAPPT